MAAKNIITKIELKENSKNMEKDVLKKKSKQPNSKVVNNNEANKEVIVIGNGKKGAKTAGKKTDPKKGGAGKGVPKLGLTPYQGDRRCHGYFECNVCSNVWTSYHSWADCGQKCKGDKCSFVYPSKQWPLERPRKGKAEGEEKQHKRGHCQKCIKVRGFCGKIRLPAHAA